MPAAAATAGTGDVHAGVTATDATALARAAIGDRRRTGIRVTVDAPPIAETGNSVPLGIDVDSPMAPDDHVEALLVLLPGNPEPLAMTCHLTPRCGRARVATRVRLARTQRIGVLALLSGSRYAEAHCDVLVTLGACIDEFFA
jgi:sulfur-oxidizing protein SoxY